MLTKKSTILSLLEFSMVVLPVCQGKSLVILPEKSGKSSVVSPAKIWEKLDSMKKLVDFD